MIAAGGLCGMLPVVTPARAQTRPQSCPGNPNALGTSRVLPIKFGEFTRLGTMQYPQTLPLADHEVVLTFDDGPRPMLTDRVLDILDSQCVKATFFIIGEMAHYWPAIVRREYAAGHSIGTHSQDHPLRFDKISDQKVQWEIDQGIASVGAALGDPEELSPFFRIPGLGRTAVVEQELAKRSLILFSADVVADDWFRHITPDQIIQRAMSRLEKRGRGILLLHDIHPATALALPGLLKALKDNGFRIVHVVPIELNGQMLAGGPKAWARVAAMLQPLLIDKGAMSPVWPQPTAEFAPTGTELPAPDEAAFAVGDPLGTDSGAADGSTGTTPWPKLAEATVPASDAGFAAPGLPDIGVSMRGQRLVSADVEPQRRPSPHVAISTKHTRSAEHARVHRVRFRARLHRARSERHRADLPSATRSLNRG